MSKKIVNFGSINIDHVYQVPHFVQPGETLNSAQLNTGLGGKGANQSVAIARAGGHVVHFGQVSSADQWAIDLLAASGVATDNIKLVDMPSGHAIIQVDDQGENAILLHGGANQGCDVSELESVLGADKEIEYLLLQNECNGLAEAIDIALARNINVVLNPAPMTESINTLPLNKLHTLIVNQVEAQMLTGEVEVGAMIRYFQRHFGDTQIVLTLGADGVVLLQGGDIESGDVIRSEAHDVSVVDTTGAGDTFVGYFLTAMANGDGPASALKSASTAAAITVTRSGAISAIPTRTDVDNFLEVVV